MIEPNLIIQELWQINVELDHNVLAGLEYRANKSINSVKYCSKIQVPRYCRNDMSFKKSETQIFFINRQKLKVALLTSESSKTIKLKFHLSFTKVD